MWLNRGLLSSKSFMGLSVGEYLLKSFTKQSKILNRGTYCKQNKFCTIIHPKGYDIEISSRRFFCSGIENNEGLASTGGKNSLSKKKHLRLELDEMEEIDDLAQYLDDVKETESVKRYCVAEEEHMNYLGQIADGDEVALKKFKIYYSIVKRLCQNLGLNLNVEAFDWKRMLESNRSSLKRCIKYQVLKEIYKTKKLIKKMEEQSPRTNSEIVTYYDISCYHLYHNSLFLRFHRSSALYQSLSKGIASMLYSPALIFDCSYEKFMKKEEIENLGKQMSLVISGNSRSIFPLHIVICNFNKSLYLGKIIEKYVSKFYENHIPITVTEKSYLDLFPKETLCYLSPNGSRKLIWSPNKNYIVGAFVDKCLSEMKISLAKAKKDDIEHMRFPLEDYVQWKKGSKSLCLPLVSDIMCRMHYYRDWRKAFEALPNRYLRENTIEKARRKNSVWDIVDDSFTHPSE